MVGLVKIIDCQDFLEKSVYSLHFSTLPSIFGLWPLPSFDRITINLEKKVEHRKYLKLCVIIDVCCNWCLR